jgi:hypothetical protein
MNVAFFTAGGGQTEEYLLPRIHSLDRRHYQPILIARPEQIAALQPQLPEGVTTIPFRLHKASRFLESFRLWRILRSRDVDILHSHAAYAGLFHFPVARLAPLIVLEGSDTAVGRRLNCYIADPGVDIQWLYRRGWNQRQDALQAHRNAMRRLARAV